MPSCKSFAGWWWPSLRCRLAMQVSSGMQLSRRERHLLQEAERRFRSLQPDRFRWKWLQDVPIAPIEELLQRHAGGSVWRGGPQPPPHQPCTALEQFRGDEQVSQPARRLEDWRSWPLLEPAVAWCGPLCHHYGHQLTDFGSRVLLASLHPRATALLFLHPQPGIQVRDLPAWQQAWIRYLNPAEKPVLIHHGGVRARRLLAIPQQQRLGRPPTLTLLKALSWRSRSLAGPADDQLLVLSRQQHCGTTPAGALKGSIAGAAAFEALLANRGARVLAPETLPLEQQLQLLHRARRIVIPEGSAMHTLELLGHDRSKQVVVIARRPLWPDQLWPLKLRFPQLVWIDAVEELHWLPPANPRVKGMAVLDWQPVLAQLAAHLGLDFNATDGHQLNSTAAEQLRILQQAVPGLTHKTRRCLDRQPATIGGW